MLLDHGDCDANPILVLLIEHNRRPRAGEKREKPGKGAGRRSGKKGFRKKKKGKKHTRADLVHGRFEREGEKGNSKKGKRKEKGEGRGGGKPTTLLEILSLTRGTKKKEKKKKRGK